jgi:hypothetical protein
MTITSKNPMEDISKARPQLKTNSVKQYVANLNKLKKIFDTDNYEFLKNPEKVMEKIEDLNYLSQRNILNAVVVLLSALNHDGKQDDLLEEYGKLRDDRNTMYIEQNKSGEISSKQAPNFTTTEEIFKMINQMADDLKPIKKKSKEDITKKEMALLQAYVLFNIYARMPFRNDLGNGAEAINQAAYKKLSEQDKKDNNFLIVPSKGNLYWVMNKYKTSKKYEQLNLPIDDPNLRKILRYYLKINGMGVLFKTSTGKPISKGELSKILIKYSKKYLNKSISSTLLRKIYLSSKYSDVKDEMEKDAKMMGNSVGTQQAVYVKKPQKDEE